MTPQVTSPPRRPDASMTLITSMLERPLDSGYAAAADRREKAGLPRATNLRSPSLIVFALIIGTLVGIAAMQLRGGETTKERTKTSLIQRIEQQQKTVDTRTRDASALRAEISELDAKTLRDVSEELGQSVQRLSLVAGAVPVRGPGFVVTLDDAPRPNDGGGSNFEPRSDTETTASTVQSRDLQVLTNSLWAAGAEAMSINGQRLTSTASIRFAGQAILVDFRPLKRPYVVTAIGDPGKMPASFADGSGGTYLSTLKSSFGIQVETSVRKEVTIPASATLGTRVATPADRVEVAATPSSKGDSS